MTTDTAVPASATDDVAIVQEHLKTILDNVLTNKKNIENQLAQVEQQKAVLDDQLATVNTAVAAMQHLIDDSVTVAPAIATRVAVNALPPAVNVPTDTVAEQAPAPALQEAAN